MPEENADNQGQQSADNQDQQQQQQSPPVVDWKQSLPQEFQSHPALTKFKTPADLFKGYTEVEKFVGYDKIPAPKRDKDGNYEKGEFERVSEALGRPKEAKEYQVSKDFKLPEGVKIADQGLDGFRAVSHKIGLLPHQFQGVLNYFADMLQAGTVAQKEAQDTAKKESELNLRTKWGATYDQKMQVANNVLRNFVDDKKMGDAIVAKYGNDPMLAELFANIGSNLSEESMSAVGQKGAFLDPVSAQAEIDKIMRDDTYPGHKAYFDAGHPQHKYFVEKVAELNRMAVM